MTLAERSIRRPITVWMVLTAAMLFGAIALGRLSLDLLPELTYPSLTIRTTFDGAAPAEVEEQVTSVLSNGLALPVAFARCTASPQWVRVMSCSNLGGGPIWTSPP